MTDVPCPNVRDHPLMIECSCGYKSTSPADQWSVQPFRVVIEGEAPATFLPTLLDGVRNITPSTGGFTLSVGITAGE